MFSCLLLLNWRRVQFVMQRYTPKKKTSRNTQIVNFTRISSCCYAKSISSKVARTWCGRPVFPTGWCSMPYIVCHNRFFASRCQIFPGRLISKFGDIIWPPRSLRSIVSMRVLQITSQIISQLLSTRKLLEMSKHQKGRPTKLDRNFITGTLLQYKKDIIQSDSRVISKKHPIWITIAEKLERTMTPNALYTYVTCNKFGMQSMYHVFQNVEYQTPIGQESSRSTKF